MVDLARNAETCDFTTPPMKKSADETTLAALLTQVKMFNHFRSLCSARAGKRDLIPLYRDSGRGFVRNTKLGGCSQQTTKYTFHDSEKTGQQKSYFTFWLSGSVVSTVSEQVV
jgi:hypothetical protein